VRQRYTELDIKNKIKIIGLMTVFKRVHPLCETWTLRWVRKISVSLSPLLLCYRHVICTNCVQYKMTIGLTV